MKPAHPWQEGRRDGDIWRKCPQCGRLVRMVLSHISRVHPERAAMIREERRGLTDHLRRSRSVLLPADFLERFRG